MTTAMFVVSTARAVETTTFYGLQILGGQYFFSGEKGSLSGNASGVIAPGFKFDENWTLMPTLSSSYQGTKQVLDVAGAGTIFQEQMDHRLSARVIYTPHEESPWRIKPNGSFKYQLLKETKDEEWSSGLFDYYKWSAGVETEYVYLDPFSARLGVDYFESKYPNYTTLESQTATSTNDQSLARELVGDAVLDTRNVFGSLAVDGPLGPKLVGELGASVLYQSFFNQPLVDEAGALIAKKRQDFMTTFSGSLKMPAQFGRVKFIGAVDASIAYNTSNQNNYDAQRTKFQQLYYNYGDLRAGPTLKAYFGPGKRPVALTLGAQYWYRRYPHRLIQDTNGAFQSESLHTNNFTITTTLNYPMVENLNLIGNFQYGKASSNQRFETFYSYNYRVANYLFGMSYGF